MKGEIHGKQSDIKEMPETRSKDTLMNRIDNVFKTKMDEYRQNKELSSVQKGDKLIESSLEKGNYGEMKTDQFMRENGYKRISLDRVTSFDLKTHQGIDGVYRNSEGKHIILDAKFGKSKLSETADGKQMSENWIDKRLDSSVGKEKADEIRMAKILGSDNVLCLVSHIDGNGNISFDKLDKNGNTTERNFQL